MVAPICAPIDESWACQRLSAQCARREGNVYLPAAHAARRCSTGWRPREAAGQSLHNRFSTTRRLLHRAETHHNARLLRPWQCCHMRLRMRLRLFVSCAANAPSPGRVSSSTRAGDTADHFCGVSRVVLLTALPSFLLAVSVCQMRADLAALPPAIRISATKSLPCRLSTAVRAPLDDDASVC